MIWHTNPWNKLSRRFSNTSSSSIRSSSTLIPLLKRSVLIKMLISFHYLTAAGKKSCSNLKSIVMTIKIKLKIMEHLTHSMRKKTVLWLLQEVALTCYLPQPVLGSDSSWQIQVPITHRFFLNSNGVFWTNVNQLDKPRARLFLCRDHQNHGPMLRLLKVLIKRWKNFSQQRNTKFTKNSITVLIKLCQIILNSLKFLD